MMKLAISLLFSSTMLASSPVFADPAKFEGKITGIADGGRIPERYAHCIPDGKNKTKEGFNFNPAIEWSGTPEGTKSFAIIVVDKDVPETFELANQEGKFIPGSFPRQNFYHWVLVDIPPTMIAISEGGASRGVVQGGKQLGKAAYGVNGQNDYARMSEGNHGGYDGPCPPWNDGIIHNYHFTVYALDVETLGLNGVFDGKYAEQMMKDHILAKDTIVGRYSNNPSINW